MGELPRIEPTVCQLRWPEPIMRSIVRALQSADAANRRLNRLAECGALDRVTFKKQQFKLIRPLRAAFSDIYALATRMHDEDGRHLSPRPPRKRNRPEWTMADKEVVERWNRRK